MPRLLEIFCGTKSVGKVFEKNGWEVTSVDLEPKFEPTICCDVLQLELDKWPPGYFDFIHASPPCTYYSRCRTTGKKVDMLEHDRISLHTVCLIWALKPKFYTIENPASSKIWQLPWLKDLPYKIASYCKYSQWGYQKHTRFATNLQFWNPMKCQWDCVHTFISNTGRKKHVSQAQCAKTFDSDKKYTSQELYRIPEALVEEIFAAAENSISRRLA